MPAKKDLADYIFTTKYARYVPEKARRETFDEAVDRVRDMMLRKYPHCEEEIRHAYDRKMRSKKVLGSQRTLQYGGSPVERNNARSFNCCYSFCDRLRFFQETFWLLLCGCGVGFSVQKHHVDSLPGFTKTRREGGNLEPKAFVVEDSIEGWADALGVLLSSYFEDPVFPEYADCLVGLDFSNVRPKGAPISSGGKAPGPEPLITALDKIAVVLDAALANGQDKLTPIQAFDIVMHSADAVLSGGTRRSATIALFSDDDQEMMTAKTGNWFAENPQRARANISALRLRDKTSFETYYASLMHARQWGEPGDYWADSTEIGPNPCQPRLGEGVDA